MDWIRFSLGWKMPVLTGRHGALHPLLYKVQMDKGSMVMVIEVSFEKKLLRVPAGHRDLCGTP